MTPRPEHALALTQTRNLARLRREDGRWLLDSAPRWLTSALDLPHRFPLEVEREAAPLGFLARISEDLTQARLNLEDYLVEIEREGGDRLQLLMAGRPLDGADQPIVELALQDVTGVVRARQKAAAVGAFHGLIGQSIPMLELYNKIATYGATDAAILITGETGTGKELVAKALHERSPRAQKSFVAVNCSALTSELFESELFGHEKGSFTGAHRQHRGRFERADGGTLFLDEIGEMPPMTQAKMLRALEEGSIERVGGEREYQVDVRVIAATNVALEHAVQTRRFRPDLYHRLSVLRVHVPALRDREGDIPLLVHHFLDMFNRRYGKHIRRLTPEAIGILEEYHWPGNVRELRNVIERLVIEVEGEVIGARSLAQWMDEREYLMPGSWNADAIYTPRPPIYAAPDAAAGDADNHAVALPRVGDAWWGRAAQPAWPAPLAPPPPVLIEAQPIGAPLADPHAEPAEITRDSIEEAFRATRGNLTRAAARLGVHKATLYRHMKRLGMSREALEAGSQEDAADE